MTSPLGSAWLCCVTFHDEAALEAKARHRNLFTFSPDWTEQVVENGIFLIDSMILIV